MRERKGLRERERERGGGRERERKRRVEWGGRGKFCRNPTLQAKYRLRHKGPDEREGGGLRGGRDGEGKRREGKREGEGDGGRDGRGGRGRGKDRG